MIYVYEMDCHGSSTLVVYPDSVGGSAAAIQLAIREKYITKPGRYFVAKPDAVSINVTEWEVTEVPQPRLVARAL